jgi:sugar/nucleoside kinase (ribokinase family)
MAGEVDVPLLRTLSSRGTVAPDAQGFVRVREGDDLVFRDWPQKREGLALVDVLKVDTAEAEVLAGQTDGRQVMRKLATYGPREIVLTRPQGVLVYAGGEYHQAPFNPREVRGRTGRGDTCFASYLGRRLTADPEEACRFAAAMTSLKLEQPGPFRGSIEDVERLKGVLNVQDQNHGW